MITLIIMLTAFAQPSIINSIEGKTPKNNSAAQSVVTMEKEPELSLPMPMNYPAWSTLSPDMKKAYAAVTVDALKWSYLFNDCDPLTPEEMIKGIDAGNPKDPVMIAAASTAYRMCQD